MASEPRYYDEKGEPTDEAFCVAQSAVPTRAAREIARLQHERDEARRHVATLRTYAIVCLDDHDGPRMSDAEVQACDAVLDREIPDGR